MLTHARHVCGLFSCDVYRQQIPANLLLVKNISAIGLYWGNYAMVAIARPFDSHTPPPPSPPPGGRSNVAFVGWLTAPMHRSVLQHDPHMFFESIQKVLEGAEAGVLRPKIGASFPLSQVNHAPSRLPASHVLPKLLICMPYLMQINDAFQFIADRKSTGKIIIDC